MREFDTNGLRLCEYQGKLFELSNNLECSTKIFFRRFLNSNLLEELDENDASRLLLIPEEGINEINSEYGKSEYGKQKYSKETLYWIGYLYRYISYTREIKTKFLSKLFKIDKLNELYYVYHTQDMEWCVTNLLEIYDYDENVFDNNWRLKNAMKGLKAII